ncbi:DUF3307 domain-containing protein [Aliishimia ponticola]|nr:DUF3307 domain-containing protein [Aliishimia ponticola]
MLALMDAISPAMLHSFTALLLAHVLADFVFQTNWMATRKADPPVLLLHVLIVFILSNLALGGVWQVAGAITLAHFAIDATKVWVVPQRHRNTFTAFLIDQVAHLLSLIVAVIWWPDAIATGLWSNIAALAFAPALIASGAILTIRAGGFAVGLLTARFSEHLTEESLPDAGRLIGQLERALIFLLIWAGHPAGVGFLVAAKSILRFDAAKDSKAGEYVIIGTLASYGWALAMSYATFALLEIGGPSP